MKAQLLLKQQAAKQGMTIRQISDATGIKYELLRRSLHGMRKMSADEFVAIMSVLGLEIGELPK